ncbi:hypothetical protein KKY_253 [Pelagibacterium halotolerans B2]|uniref:Uncharacterized protein n=1 Tax=Pelagibacterium halotolerans (strain DSM 22347 / JCM 15775 / CGMCC 1.7692 / B2) TaxID=1082931 RepID=G4R803_PELHB|nr:hypothetical protein KKY_253 [Pelagibacterium halotolerans B2]
MQWRHDYRAALLRFYDCLEWLGKRRCHQRVSSKSDITLAIARRKSNRAPSSLHTMYAFAAGFARRTQYICLSGE